MTQYRWIVVSVLAVFVLSALCTPSDAVCTDETSCRSCRGQLIHGDSANCQWCSLFANVDPTTPEDTPRLSYGFCVAQGECRAPNGSTSPQGLSWKVVDNERLCAAAAVRINPLFNKTCLNCFDDTDNSWCSATVNEVQSGVCLGPYVDGTTTTSSAASCLNALAGVEATYNIPENRAECCPFYPNCSGCAAAGTECSWCALTEPSDTGGDPTSINVGVCVASTAENSCSSATFGTLTDFVVNSIPSGTPSCTDTPSVHFNTEETCATCLVVTGTDNSWCPFKDSGVATGGLCLTSAESCTRAALGLSTGGELTAVEDSADCCSSQDNCADCDGGYDCSWCALTEPSGTAGDRTKLNVGVCVAGTADTNCDSTTFGGLKEVVLAHTDTCTTVLTAAQVATFDATTCLECHDQFKGHWCRLFKDSAVQGGLCLKDTASCDLASLGFITETTFDSVSQLENCCSIYESCDKCKSESRCAWCSPTKANADGGGDPTFFNVGKCLLESEDQNGADNSCSSATFGTLTGFVVNSIPSGAPSCTDTPSVHFNTEETCATCLTVTGTNNSWCPLSDGSTTIGGLCSPTQDCDFTVTANHGFTFQDPVTSESECPTPAPTTPAPTTPAPITRPNEDDDTGGDGEETDAEEETDDKKKASTAFSMFSGSAVGFISAVAISGFVM